MSKDNVIFYNNRTYMTYVKSWGQGRLPCHSNGQLAYADEWLTCAAYQLPFVLETIGFGYITVVLNLIIILISIFGKIKENYKWFILNQALWDLLISYDFICDKPSHKYFTNANPEYFDDWNQGPPNCFYSTTETSPAWLKTFSSVLKTALNKIPVPLLFLLSFSRFLALFCPIFYKRHMTLTKITIFILSFDFIAIVLLNILIWWPLFFKPAITSSLIALGIQNLTYLLWLLLTFIFTVAIFTKVLIQVRYQFQQKHTKNLDASCRISFVLVFQCATVILFFSVTFFTDFLMTWISQVSIFWFKQQSVFLMLPNWLTQFNEHPQVLNILKIALDSIILLTVLSGYNSNIKKMVIAILKPGRVMTSYVKGFRSDATTTTEVTILSNR